MQSQFTILGIALFSTLRQFNFGVKICARNSGLLSGELSIQPLSFWDIYGIGLGWSKICLNTDHNQIMVR